MSDPNRAHLRIQANLSLAYVARMTAVTEGTVKRYEDGSLASDTGMHRRLDAFYEWLAQIPAPSSSTPSDRKAFVKARRVK